VQRSLFAGQSHRDFDERCFRSRHGQKFRNLQRCAVPQFDFVEVDRAAVDLALHEVVLLELRDHNVPDFGVEALDGALKQKMLGVREANSAPEQTGHETSKVALHVSVA